MIHKKFVRALVGAVVGLGALPLLALAIESPDHYTLFNEAVYLAAPDNGSDRAVRLTSDFAASTQIAGIEFYVADSETYNFAGLHTLSTDYRFAVGDTCTAGTPKFRIAVQDPSTLDVYNILVPFGEGCPENAWTNTGDVIGTLPLDTSELPLGSSNDPYASAVLKYGTWKLIAVQLHIDGWFNFGDLKQVVDIDNTLVNSTPFDYEEEDTDPEEPPTPVNVPPSKDQCKKGGWENYTDNLGTPFKNQGDCVSYVATGGKNKAGDH